MGLTTWDGHLRVDRDPAGTAVTLTLLTLEPTTEAPLRSGLVAGFVTGDAQGPPAFVRVATVDGRLPVDIAVLLGARVSSAAEAVAGGDGAGTWLQLEPDEIDDLAVAWAPYRVRVLLSAPSVTATPVPVGAWAGGLWACAGLPRWSDVIGSAVRELGEGLRGARDLGAPAQVAPEFRSSDAERAGAAVGGVWLLPPELARAVGCRPALTWTVVSAGRTQVELEVVAEPVGQAAETLWIGLDDGSDRWVPLRTGSDGRLRTRVAGSGAATTVRFRSEPAGEPS